MPVGLPKTLGEADIISAGNIIGAANIICRRQTSFKKRAFVGRQKCAFCWSRVRESNPPSRLGKPLYYRYTNPARLCKGIIAKQKGNFNLFLSIKSAIVGKNMVAKSKPPCYNTACVHVAQPFLCIGMSPSGKAPDFDSGISSVRIRPSQPNTTR